MTESSRPGFEELVAVMDRLRSPGGCPWDAEQTHASLAPYAVEEAHEVAEAAESGDLIALREELGDLLLQVVFQARVAQEHDTHAFDVHDVVAELVAKLRRRHPHVFADAAGVRSPGDVEAVWQQVKAVEKPTSDVLDGIPAAMPALARGQKVVRRLRRAGLTDVLSAGAASSTAPEADGHGSGAAESFAEELLALVIRAEDAGVDAEAALRGRLRRLTEASRGLRDRERTRPESETRTEAPTDP